jgi:hypothetical protein
MPKVKVNYLAVKSGIFKKGGLELYRKLEEIGSCHWSQLCDKRVYRTPSTLNDRLKEGQEAGLLTKRATGIEQRDGRWYFKEGEKYEIIYEITFLGRKALRDAEKLEQTLKEARI